MKDYRLDHKAEPNYIVSVKEKKSKKDDKISTLEVKFADGRKFKNIIANDINISRIIKQQEAQAKSGVENVDVFKNRKTRDGIATAITFLSGGAGIINMMASDAHTIAIGTGAITLLAAIPFVCSLVRNSGKVRELNKIKYRDDHRAELEKFLEYENSLVGLPEHRQRWFKNMMDEGIDPFCITLIDSYSQKDLEQISKNMNTEKEYQFTYVYKPKSNE